MSDNTTTHVPGRNATEFCGNCGEPVKFYWATCANCRNPLDVKAVDSAEAATADDSAPPPRPRADGPRLRADGPRASAAPPTVPNASSSPPPPAWSPPGRRSYGEPRPDRAAPLRAVRPADASGTGATPMGVDPSPSTAPPASAHSPFGADAPMGAGPTSPPATPTPANPWTAPYPTAPAYDAAATYRSPAYQAPPQYDRPGPQYQPPYQAPTSSYPATFAEPRKSSGGPGAALVAIVSLVVVLVLVLVVGGLKLSSVMSQRDKQATAAQTAQRDLAISKANLANTTANLNDANSAKATQSSQLAAYKACISDLNILFNSTPGTAAEVAASTQAQKDCVPLGLG
ncbi:MAG TPA: hypothetical protein VHT75_07630 [Acidimicrobiales bacterium]|nr:hypothetical protein [Acidimicrobiales bacterium]